MDKYIDVFCKQNPVTKMKCLNPDCQEAFEVKSSEFFKDRTYTYNCDICNKSSEYDTTKFVEEFKKILKQMGVTVK